jgi:hypothetical protein
MYSIIYFIHFGKDCQAVFPENQRHLLDVFIQGLDSESTPYSQIDVDAAGNFIPSREEVTNV